MSLYTRLVVYISVLVTGITAGCSQKDDVEEAGSKIQPSSNSEMADTGIQQSWIYATEVMSHSRGLSIDHQGLSKPEAVLGAPDWQGEAADSMAELIPSSTFHSLGCGGEIVLGFGTKRLTDIAGDDLEVLQIKDMTKPLRISLSSDGQVWRTAGVVDEKTGGVDIANAVRGDETLRYMRISNLFANCGDGEFPGATIDAVRVMGWREINVSDVRFTEAEPPYRRISFIPASGSFRIEVSLIQPTEENEQLVTLRPPGKRKSVTLIAEATNDPTLFRTASLHLDELE